MRFSGLWDGQARGHRSLFYGCHGREGWGVRIVVGLLYVNVCMSNVYSSMAECLERRGGYWDAGWRIWGVRG